MLTAFGGDDGKECTPNSGVSTTPLREGGAVEELCARLCRKSEANQGLWERRPA